MILHSYYNYYWVTYFVTLSLKYKSTLGSSQIRSGPVIVMHAKRLQYSYIIGYYLYNKVWSACDKTDG